jgi:hypothetical protein
MGAVRARPVTETEGSMIVNRSNELAKSRRRVARQREAEALGQPSLFGVSSCESFTAAAPRRVSNPPCTSRMAFAAVTGNGKRAGQMRAIVDFLRTQTSPLTSYEIAIAIGVDRSGPGRRMSDLEVAGLVRRRAVRTCSISGAPSITWEAI